MKRIAGFSWLGGVSFCVVLAAAAAGAGLCDTPPTCPTPAPGDACVSGQLYDLETGDPLRTASPSGLPCAQQTATGPCSIDIVPFDALGFVQNPIGTPPLPADVVVDDCGSYLVSDFPAPGLGFVAMTTDDAPPSDDRLLAARLLSVSDGSQLDFTPLFVARATTDQAWTTSAGDPFGGQTFAEKGVYVALFRNGRQPATNTVLTRNGGAQAGDDYYFEDADPSTRSTVDSTLSATGVNGAALMVDSNLENHSGVGGERPNCVWPVHLGDAVPGVVIVQEFESVDSLSGDPCHAGIPVGISTPLLAACFLLTAATSLGIRRRRSARGPNSIELASSTGGNGSYSGRFWNSESCSR